MTYRTRSNKYFLKLIMLLDLKLTVFRKKPFKRDLNPTIQILKLGKLTTKNKRIKTYNHSKAFLHADNVEQTSLTKMT